MGNANALEADLEMAIAQRGVKGTSAVSLARHVQAVIQGSFVLAKTQEGTVCAEVAREQIGHLRRYFSMLFNANAEETLQ